MHNIENFLLNRLNACLGTQKNHRIQTVLMSTHNIFLDENYGNSYLGVSGEHVNAKTIINPISH